MKECIRKFYTMYDKPKNIPHQKTSKTRPVYSESIDNNGHKKLVHVGETNIYEKIQSFKEETLIYNVLDRFNAGDIQAINKVKGMYGDFTEMPTTLMEAQNQLIKAERTFNELPIEVRAEFNHSYEQFLSAATKGEAEKRINEVVSKINKNTLNAVKELESTTKPVETTVATKPVEEGIKYE